jgi:hypothetical protein
MAPKYKTYDAHYYFDLEVDDETPDYAIETMLEKIMDDILDAWYKKKQTSISGDISYNDEPSDDYGNEK